MTYMITMDDLSDPTVLALISTHLDFAARFTPAGSGHALDVAALKAPDMTFWVARTADTPVGCVALKGLDDIHGEVKSLHVLAPYRGQGIARALMADLEQEARARGLQRLSLETGKGEGFAPSRQLYEMLGFKPCAPFGDYASDAFSHCMNKRIS